MTDNEKRGTKQRVTPAYLDAQRTLGWPDVHPEDYCHRCGNRNTSWWVDSDVWNAVMESAFSPHHGIICPSCFGLRFEEKFPGTSWELRLSEDTRGARAFRNAHPAPPVKEQTHHTEWAQIVGGPDGWQWRRTGRLVELRNINAPHCQGCATFEHHHCYHCGKRAGLPHPTWCPNFDQSAPEPQDEPAWEYRSHVVNDLKRHVLSDWTDEETALAIIGWESGRPREAAWIERRRPAGEPERVPVPQKGARQ